MIWKTEIWCIQKYVITKKAAGLKYLPEGKGRAYLSDEMTNLS